MRDKERHCITIKGSTLLEYVILIVYVSNKRVSKYVKQKLIELHGEIDETPIIVGDFRTPEMDRSSRHKIRKDTVELSNVINQLDIMDTLNTLYTEYYLQNKLLFLNFI